LKKVRRTSSEFIHIMD